VNLFLSPLYCVIVHYNDVSALLYVLPQPPGEAAAPVDFNALIQMAKERAAQVAAGKPMAPPPVVPVASDSM
jgi:hypothetical protein